MDDVFQEGGSALLIEGDRSFLMTLDGTMAKLKGARGGISTSRIIGMKVGDTLTVGNRSFVLMRPDIRDHIENIERGPQIIIPKDASEIITGLGLTNGSVVLEAGAGSGGLSLFLLNAVSPMGKVITYDIRKDHLEITRSNITRAGLIDGWDGKVGDILDGAPQKNVDAVVLDLPQPELAVHNLIDSLRIGSRFCAYVPTFNQMERVVLALKREGFINIEPVEIIRRPFSVKEGATRPVTEILSHTGFLIFARWIGLL